MMNNNHPPASSFQKPEREFSNQFSLEVLNNMLSQFTGHSLDSALILQAVKYACTIGCNQNTSHIITSKNWFRADSQESKMKLTIVCPIKGRKY